MGLLTRDGWIRGAGYGMGSGAAVQDAAAAFAALWAAAAEKPDGVICTDDYDAVGAVRAMRELGLEPGRDVRIASHANRGSDVLEGLPVIPVAFDPAEIARVMLQAVCKLVDGVAVPKRIVVPPTTAADNPSASLPARAGHPSRAGQSRRPALAT